MLSPKQILDVASYAGEVILTNGAEIYRAEETIVRICNAYGINYVQALVTPTGIFVSIDNGDGVMETIVRRMRHRSINLTKICKINDFSRKLENELLSFEGAMAELKAISTGKNEYTVNTTILFGAIGGAVNVILMKGNIIDFIPAFLAAVLAQLTVRKISILKDVNFVPEMIAGFICGFVSLTCFKWGLGDSLSITIVSSVLPFVPGVALTNAIRDAVSDDLISATSRLTEAALIAVSLAIGAAISLGVFYR